MGTLSLDAVGVTTLRQIPTSGGDVWHALRQDAEHSVSFGEAYFSWVDHGAIKGWKRHTRMTMNLVVPVGHVRFVMAIDGSEERRVEDVGPSRYVRITVPPGIWCAFQGLTDARSLVLNIGSIPHDPAEVDRRDLHDITFDWTDR